MYAVIATCGRQFKVQEKEVIVVERIEGSAGDKVSFSEVLALGEGEGLKLGSPTISGAVVEGEILDHLRGPKLIAFKMKRRKGYRKRKGHRQELTKVRITALPKV